MARLGVLVQRARCVLHPRSCAASPVRGSRPATGSGKGETDPATVGPPGAGVPVTMRLAAIGGDGMSDKPNVTAATPIWRIVFTRELRDLWVGGKALYMILMYTLLLGVYAFVMASNA